jgi:N-sulfoglucosamine sulfohydrolase
MEGVMYTNAHATAPVCSTSRSALITGRYQTSIGAHHHRSHRTDGFQLDARIKLLPEMLRDAGYFNIKITQVPETLALSGNRFWH